MDTKPKNNLHRVMYTDPESRVIIGVSYTFRNQLTIKLYPNFDIARREPDFSLEQLVVVTDLTEFYQDTRLKGLDGKGIYEKVQEMKGRK